MSELELVRVHEDGEHLVLAGPDGTRFALPIDDALRVAMRRDRVQLEQMRAQVPGVLPVRDIQSQLRAGLSAREVAEKSGVPIEQVHRFEGPVIAEQEYVVGQVRKNRVGHDEDSPPWARWSRSASPPGVSSRGRRVVGRARARRSLDRHGSLPRRGPRPQCTLVLRSPDADPARARGRGALVVGHRGRRGARPRCPRRSLRPLRARQQAGTLGHAPAPRRTHRFTTRRPPPGPGRRRRGHHLDPRRPQPAPRRAPAP
ncbi:septation protein SepH [Oerskovia sp. M15]